MTRRRRAPPPRSPRLPPRFTPDILELDRFSSVDLQRWLKLSADLDEYASTLYFGIEPQRLRFRDALHEALTNVPACSIELVNWVRLVDYRYALSPLSAAGSLTAIGGRFNIGVDVDESLARPWPALYLAEDFETAYREKFQLASHERHGGLTPEELALRPIRSFASVTIDGHVDRAFDLTAPHALDALCRVFAKMKLPGTTRAIEKRLKLTGHAHAALIRSPHRLRDEVLSRNWRVNPIQFGLPANSQLLAGMIRDAGFEAIRYPSTQGDGACLALFPDRLASERTTLRLHDAAPVGTQQTELNMSSADGLCGWELLRVGQRPPR